MDVSNSSEDEKRTSQSSDDTIQKADDKVKKQEEPQTMRRENQIPKRDANDPKNPSNPLHRLRQIAAKVIPDPAPKMNNWEVRTNNQQTAPVSAQREVKRSEVEATRDTSSDNVLSMSRDHSEAIIQFDFSPQRVSRAENAETSELPLMFSKDERQEPHEGNIWETRAKERETKRRPESSDKQVRRIAVSVGNAVRGKGGQGQRRPYNRRDEPVTSVSLYPKQMERQVPTSYEDMPKLKESHKKRLRVTNKFSSVLDEDDNENTSQSENKGIEEPRHTRSV